MVPGTPVWRVVGAASARRIARCFSSASIPGTAQLAALFKEQGHAECDPAHRSGLHPLVLPLAEDGKEVLGVLRWPAFNGEDVVVRTERQSTHVEDGTAALASLTLRPFGSPLQYARRAGAEADAAGGDSGQVIAAAAEVSGALGMPAYAAGELSASKLKIDQYLLLRVGPFPDVWEVPPRFASLHASDALQPTRQ
eukprot:2994299-Prymnesium_polylepis.3